jgi:hypothetical protein
MTLCCHGNATIPNRCMRTYKRRDVSKVKGAFRDCADAPKTNSRLAHCYSLKSHLSQFTDHYENVSDLLAKFTVHSLFGLLTNQRPTETPRL